MASQRQERVMSIFKSDETYSGKISVVAQIRAKSGHEDDVRAMFSKVVGPSQKEAGCLKYNLFEDVHYTGSFFTMEEWINEEALTTHLTVNKAALDKAKALLREDLRISVLKLIE
jgi:quinol monooxygenase YgiN